jgi:TonB family protein
MNTESSRSLFSSDVTSAPTSWRGYATSAIVHTVVAVLIFMIHAALTTPEIERPTNRTTLTKTLLAPYRPKPIRAPKVAVPPPQVAKVRIPPKPKVVPPPVVAPPPAPKPVVEAHREAPKEPVPAKPVEVASAKPLPAAHIEQPRPQEPAPIAKPQIRTGVFGSGDSSNKSQAAKQVKMGGFGDPSGVQPSKEDKGPTLLAKVGSFDLPPGAGQGGGGQKATAIRQGVFGGGDGSSGSGTATQGKGRGTVSTGGFGDAASGSPQGQGGTGGRGTVSTGGFSNAAAAPVETAQRTQPTAPVATPVEILFKPKPVYTQEARALKVEGEAALEVIFSAAGSIRVIRVLHGLGHGLDQAAEQAAAQIRFKPSTRDGAPVDTKAVIRIVFQLS